MTLWIKSLLWTALAAAALPFIYIASLAAAPRAHGEHAIAQAYAAYAAAALGGITSAALLFAAVAMAIRVRVRQGIWPTGIRRLIVAALVLQATLAAGFLAL